MSEYQVREIPKNQTHDLLLNVHYAKRIPPISFAFGLFKLEKLVGVVTFGVPASPPLCKGICGQEFRHLVLELNRLCLVNNAKGEASRLVGASLRLLPKPRIIVSYADTAQDHVGVVYQATNFIYTGKTKPRTELAVKGLEHMHSKALSNLANKQELLKKYGDRVYQRPRSVKHRYIYFIGSKKDRANFMQNLRYSVLPYPKSNLCEPSHNHHDTPKGHA